MDKTRTIYRIELPTSQDIETARKEFKANYAMLKYQKDKHYSDLVIVMGLSRNDGFMSKVVNANEGKAGRPKKAFVRDDKNPFYNTSLPHETHLHQHIYLAGQGSAMTAQKMRKRKNRKAGKIICEQFTNNHTLPYAYVKAQSFEFRAVGNYEAFLEDK